ncbi:MAG TPA: hypothetical protein PLT47_01905 [Bacteroidales bacterium]|nr:hypothetical protein [Bacteroidales bacterium]HQI69476.1 hypothetical protein [Bacteroidales bacterium]
MDPQIDPDFFEKIIPATVSLIVTGLICVIIGIYFEKFKNKIIFLKYKLFFQPLATTSQNEYWGDIAVFHNKRIVKHLSFVTVEIKNDSNKDIDNINVDIWTDNESQFLAVRGSYNEIGNAILLDKDYFNYFSDVLARNQQNIDARNLNPDHEIPQQLMNEISFVMANKKFHLPVFNRHTSITLHLLVENFKGLKPQVVVSVLHKSVKLLKEEDREEERKRRTIWTLAIGLSIFIICFSLLLKFYADSTVEIILCGILGLTYSLFGLSFYQLGRFIKRFFW